MKSHRKTCLLAASLCALAWLCWATGQEHTTQQTRPLASAQTKQEHPPLTFEKIAGPIHQVKGGSGANCGVIIGEKEIVVIDAKMTEQSAKQMLEQIKTLSPYPIGFVILTHSDGDHVNGLAGFPAGIRLIAHEQTKRDMDEAFKEEGLRAHLPQVETFSDQKKIRLDNREIEILYFGPAHTSGDIIVYLPEEKVVFLGDLYFRGRDPLIHRHKNGNSFGLVKVLKAVLELRAEIFVSGHSDRATRDDIKAFVAALEEKQVRIKNLIDEGKSLEEIKGIFNIEDRTAQPGRPRWLSLPEVIYLELTEKK